MNIFGLQRNAIACLLFSLASLTLLATGCGPSADSLKEVTQPNDGTKRQPGVAQVNPRPFSSSELGYTDFPSVNIRLVAPANAEPAEQFHGFKHNKFNATVTITTTPMAFESVTKGVIMEMARYSEVTFDDKNCVTKSVELDGQPGVYAFIKQQMSEGLFGVHILAFGGEHKSWVIKGSYPVELDAELSDEFLKSVMSAKRILTSGEEPAELVSDVDFSLTSEMMKLTPGWSKTIAFTKDGVFPIIHPGDPFFKAERQVDSTVIPEDQRAAFALQALRPAPNILVDDVFIDRAITVDGVPGREIMALAHTELTGFGIVLYSAILFEEDSHVSMNGLVGQDVIEDYPKEFKSIARSYKSKYQK